MNGYPSSQKCIRHIDFVSAVLFVGSAAAPSMACFLLSLDVLEEGLCGWDQFGPPNKLGLCIRIKLQK